MNYNKYATCQPKIQKCEYIIFVNLNEEDVKGFVGKAFQKAANGIFILMHNAFVKLEIDEVLVKFPDGDLRIYSQEKFYQLFDITWRK